MAIKASATITLSTIRDISSVTWYYLLQASTAAAPSKPTASPPGGSWKDSEPSYTSGNTQSLYITERTVYTDGTFEYSTPHLSSSYEAAKEAYNKADNAQTVAGNALAQSIEYIVGTQTAATNLWTGKTQDATLKAGKTIAYKLPYAGTSSAATLNLTLSGGGTTGAKNVRLNNNTNVTTHYAAGAVIKLTFDGTYWSTENYYSNTSYTQFSSNVTAGANGIRGYSLCMRDSENTWSCLCHSTGNGTTTATGKVAYENGFILGKIIYSAGVGAQNNNSALDTYQNYKAGVVTTTVYDVYPFDFRYSSNCGTTLTARKKVYLVGTVLEDGLFYLDTTTWWTQTLPTTEDGKTYVLVGEAYSTYTVWLAAENPAYIFENGELKELEISKVESHIADIEDDFYDMSVEMRGGYNVSMATDNVAVNPSEFLANFLGDDAGTTQKDISGDYVFTKSSGVWKYNNGTVDLDDYGIEADSSVTSITITVSKVSGLTDAIDGLATRQGQAEANANKMQGDIDEQAKTIKSHTSTLEAHNTTLAEYKAILNIINPLADSIQKMIRLDPTIPQIEVTAGNSSVVITSSNIQIQSNGAVRAYAGQNAFVAPSLQASEVLMRVKDSSGTLQGGGGFIMRQNGHMSLKKIAGGE